MILRLSLFIGTFLSILFAANLLLYFSAIRFLSLVHPLTRVILVWVLFALSLAFFVSAVLIRLHGNRFFGTIYLLSAFWMGLLANLLMASVALWGLWGLVKWIKISIPFVPITCGVYGLAFAAAILGVWYAAHPVVRNIEVGLKNLPSAWEGKTVVQLSDVHLGAVHGRDFMERVAKQVNALSPPLILITGDLLDGMDGDLSGLAPAVDSMKAEKGVYFITGNHEGYIGIDIAREFIGQTSVRNIDGKVEDVEGLQLVGVPYPLFDQSSNPKAIFESPEYDPSKPTILMYHTPTNVGHQNNSLSHQQTTAYWTPDLDTSFARDKGVDLQLSGHTHQGQMPPFSWIASAIYRGRSHGLFRDGPFQLYVSSGVGTWGPPLRLFNRGEIVAITLRKA